MYKFAKKASLILVGICIIPSFSVFASGRTESAAVSPNSGQPGDIKTVFTISESFGDGQKVTNVICEYEKEIDPTSIDIGDFEVKDRKVVPVHTNSKAERTAENKAGRYVVLDLEIQSPLLEDRFAADGRVDNYKAFDDAVVLQKGAIKAADGTVIASSAVPAATRASSGIMRNQSKIYITRDDFEDSHFYTDPEWKTVVKYNLFKPKGYVEGDTSTKYPLVLYMADAGAESKNWETVFIQGNGATVWATDEWQAEHPCFVVAMSYEEKFINDYWEYYENITGATMNLVRSLSAKYPVDTKRIYTTGQSMGCMNSMIMMIQYPSLFTAAFCIAGQWETNQLMTLKNSKLFLLNSEDDAMATRWMDAATTAWENNGTKVVRGSIDGIASSELQGKEINNMLSQNSNIYYLKINTGTGSMDLNGNPLNGSHRNTWRLGYDLPGIKEWLFQQTK
jgi:predicted peptidase